MTWHDVATLLKNNLEKSFSDRISFFHIEFMTKDWFAETRAQELLESKSLNFPFVLVNGEIACAEAKVNISKIRRFLQSKLEPS